MTLEMKETEKISIKLLHVVVSNDLLKREFR